MIKLTITQLAEILNGKLIGDTQTTVETVSTDTRQAVENGLFFALKGAKFDAHDYLQNAVDQGCVAAVLEKECPVAVPQIIVADTRLALGELAKWLKAKLNPKTVAMTGSSGKTSVKEMTAKILQHFAGNPDDVLYTFGNLNNDFGVPMTLLRLTEQHQFAVVELGANHIGEIAYTTAIVQPDACLVNNVAHAHIEGFGSLAGVAQAKGEIYRGLPENGIAIVNLAHYSPEWQKEIGNRELRSFSYTGADQDSYADYWAENVNLHLNGADFTLHTPQGEIEIHSPHFGEHNISNALAATALAMSVGADLASVKAGLEQKSSVKGRLFPVSISENILLIDDTYNANLDSMTSAINVLKSYPAFRIFAVGDMGELGAESAELHQEVANRANAAGLDLIVSFGKESAVISDNPAHHFTDKQAMADFVIQTILQKKAANQPLVLLAKGSRSQKMEELIKAICDHFEVEF
ncbi:UDP-N-acetylmuramoyl-tripeptide--D-alanyl-D- alanine ligase [Bibersteinia trehalosi USDA-ARS-USMARC-190]|uniref:UDP-N-acetylmuramoyl-tripeptide--D-alanyl-D-alanine ligase n=1 Tax=Bibersteinia trehalosi USDA-ARS-USMARC-190 TaxID=1263832 RepID=W0R8U7_BIBTR|nr:UDP-N-acetylmuramoyl-tripeptide--D-alanyl-D-alanine ligase [Bibersteinia trehalosi]AHG85813.1 UDP-N-acetylmuramoyl-tripeptide--D-alanyl-D- alanine ligase [Bibersteinia trehalosi USDA-ARS-USMARC-190]